MIQSTPIFGDVASPLSKFAARVEKRALCQNSTFCLLRLIDIFTVCATVTSRCRERLHRNESLHEATDPGDGV